MSPHQVTAPQPTTTLPVRIGVGIDNSRYGHYAAFLRDDLQPAADELAFAESAEGYTQLHQRLEHIARRHPAVAFVVRVDAAGPYADNLLHFLQHRAAQPAPQTGPPPPGQHYPLVRRSPTQQELPRRPLRRQEIRSRRGPRRRPFRRQPAARPHAAALPPLRTLRQVAARLQATVRQRTRLLNQFHHLLALTFPELGLLVQDLALGRVLELIQRYPTARLLGAATVADLQAIPYLPERHVPRLLELARSCVAALEGPAAEELVRDQVRQLRDANARQKRLENRLVQAYRGLTRANHLDTIPGIGVVTAAVLTAFILDIDRFEKPGKLVAYFGVLPIEMSSGVDRDGQPRGSRRWVMSKRGNDRVRR